MIEPSRELRDVCAIVGTGHSRLGRVPGVSSLDLLVEAMHNAIIDASLKVTDIDGIICRGPDESYAHHQQIGARLGINAHFSTTLDNGGASQILGVALATMAIKAGMASTVIVGFGRDSWSRTHSSKEANVRNETRPDSLLAHEFGPEYGHFGAVAVAFREYALRNPDAQMKKPLTMAQYHESPPVVAPFGMLDCSLRSDAAGAVIVTSRERARDLRQPPVS